MDGSGEGLRCDNAGRWGGEEWPVRWQLTLLDGLENVLLLSHTRDGGRACRAGLRVSR